MNICKQNNTYRTHLYPTNTKISKLKLKRMYKATTNHDLFQEIGTRNDPLYPNCNLYETSIVNNKESFTIINMDEEAGYIKGLEVNRNNKEVIGRIENSKSRILEIFLNEDNFLYEINGSLKKNRQKYISSLLFTVKSLRNDDQENTQVGNSTGSLEDFHLGEEGHAITDLSFVIKPKLGIIYLAAHLAPIDSHHKYIYISPSPHPIPQHLNQKHTRHSHTFAHKPDTMKEEKKMTENKELTYDELQKICELMEIEKNKEMEIHYHKLVQERNAFQGNIHYLEQEINKLALDKLLLKKINQDQKEKIESLELAIISNNIKDLPYTVDRLDDLTDELLPPTLYKRDRNFHKKCQHHNTVHLYQHLKSNELFILKQVDFFEKCKYGGKYIDSEKELLKREFVNMMKASEKNEYVTKPIHLYFNERYGLFLMEYGGKSIDEYWNPPTHLDYVAAYRQLASGLHLLHSKFIYQGDIKPENILCHKGRYKFTDFGASVNFTEEQFNKTTINFRGKILEVTPRYLPPEIQIPIKNEIQVGENIKWEAVDSYSLAFTIYSMIIRRPPLEEEKLKNSEATYQEFLRTVEYYIEKEAMSSVKKVLKNIILTCLSFNPHMRYTPQQIMEMLLQFILYFILILFSLILIY